MIRITIEIEEGKHKLHYRRSCDGLDKGTKNEKRVAKVVALALHLMRSCYQHDLSWVDNPEDELQNLLHSK